MGQDASVMISSVLSWLREALATVGAFLAGIITGTYREKYKNEKKKRKASSVAAKKWANSAHESVPERLRRLAKRRR